MYLLAHANPTGGESQSIRLHLGDASYDETLAIGLTAWRALLAAAAANNRSTYDTVIQAAVTPTGGWTSSRLDAAWRAGRRNWAP